MDPEALRIPKTLLLAAGGLVAITLTMAGVARSTGIGATSVPVAAAVEHRDLRFEDRPNGGVAVLTDDHRTLVVLSPGQDGFVRVVMRSLARDRRLNGQDHETPFRLTRWADERLSIDDPVTGKRVELGSFGAVNKASFARLMSAEARTP